MGRPKRIGLDYFPFDVDFFEDEKVLPVSVEFGAKGEIVIIRLLCAIYREGYFARWSEGLKFKIANQAKVSEHLVNDVVLKLVKYHFFNEELFNEFQILSSTGIQKRWNEATRKRVDLEEKEFWLLGKSIVSGGRNPVFGGRKAEESAENDTESTQSKLNKSKRKKEKIDPPGDTPLENKKIDYQKLVKYYHEKCKGMPQVKIMSEARKKVVKARVKEYGKKTVSEMIEKAGKSQFLNGSNDRGWTANFDWIFKPSNFVKIIDGCYIKEDTQKTNSNEPERPDKW